MKRIFLSLMMVAIASTVWGQAGQQATQQNSGLLKPTVKVQDPAAAADERSLGEKAAFIMGYNYYAGMKSQGVELDLQQFIAGINKAAANEPIGMTREEMSSVVMAYQRAIEKRVREEMIAKAETNKAAGQAFLAENAKKEGVQTMDSGIQYLVLNQGSGKTPTKTDKVKVHYHGTLIDGTVFDSSVKPLDGSPPEPAQFAVGGVIRGFSESLQNMKVGDKWRVFIPSDLAYGMRGPGSIGPNQTLIFELELLDVMAASDGQAPNSQPPNDR